MLKRKKRLKKMWLWTRIRQVRLKRWWFRNDNRYGLAWRLGNGALAVLILVAAVIPVLQQWSNNAAYKLSADTLKLVGGTDPTLTKQLTYDGNSQTYQFNKSAIKGDASNPLSKLQSQVGTASGKGKNKSLYALDVPQAINKGVTYHDINSGLSFSLVPQFTAKQGQEVQGHLVFPMADSTQAIYTLKNNGLKEDIVLQKAAQDTITFSYQLDLPKSLEAKVIPDSGGAIGIYSADPTLFGDITYGSDKDRATVEKARENGDKTYLVFGLPSPVIKAPDGSSVGDARFELDGNHLSVVASGLSSVKMPVTIDPSVVVTSTGDFQSGNAEDNVSFSTSGQVTRGAVTGGSISAGWSSAGSSFTTARYGNAAVAYNGYLYVIGGCSTQTSLTACNSAYLSDVQYIAINSSTGALTGSWASAGNSFSTARFGLSAVAYNGYLYVAGGYGGSYQNDVQYIAIDPSTGALTGSWASAGNTFSNARYFQSAVAYNNYLYVAGGYDGSTYYNDVQYAVFNADGTIGSFASAGNTFTTGRFGLSAVAYNNYLYVVGGCSAGTCSTYKSDTQYAPINSDGTIGTFTTGTSFTTARFGQAVTVYNGYLYLAGGNGGSYQTDSQYAQVNANGTLGSWATANITNNLSADALAGAAAYNGYLYTVGGTVSGTPNAGTQYATIDVTGTTTSYGTTTGLNNGTTNVNITAGAAIAYANHLYVFGGSSTGANTLATGQMATINADGTIGSWSATTSMTFGETLTGATIYNGFVYIVGGNTNDGGGNSPVQYASINANTGVVGSWTTTTVYPNASTDDHNPVAYNGFMYYRGSGGGSNATINYALICTGSNNGVGGCGSTAGALGTWNSVVNNLNTSRNFDSLLAYNGVLYIVGGSVNAGTDLRSVEYAHICDGVTTSNGCNNSGSPRPLGYVGTWHFTHNSTDDGTSTSNALGTDRERHGTLIMNGYMYVVTGLSTSGGTALGTVESAPINANGTVGSFTPNTSLPFTTTNGQYAAYNGYIYSISGKVNSSRANTIYYAAVNNGGLGASGNWATNGTSISGAYSSGWSSGRLFASGGYLYTVGGYDGTNALNTTYSAPINAADGTVGSWTAKTTLNSARYNFALSVYNGYVYASAGVGSGGDLNSVEYAQINSGGGLGSWTSATMNTGGGSVSVRGLVSGAAYNGYLYVLGGLHSGTSYSDVYYASLDASTGAVGTWASTTSFTTARNSQSSFAYNGYLYILGGLDGSSNYLGDVQYAALNSSNGTAGTWLSGGLLMQPRALMKTIVSNGFVYIFAGTNTAGTLTDTEFTWIGPGGTLGTWQSSPGTAFSVDRTSPGAAVYNGVVYMAGGLHSATYKTDLQYVSLNAIARVGHYSKLVDLTAAMNVTSITNLNAASASLLPAAVTYRAAGSNAVFGSTGQTSSVSGSNGCLGNATGTRYVWVSITLDDSSGMGTDGTFPDAAGTSANVASFTINYNVVHAAPNIRLRGGKTLQSGSLGVLDTCGA